MKNIILFSLLAATLLLSTAFTLNQTDNQTEKKAVESWVIDKDHSAINFSVRHFFTPVNGRFEEYQSDIQFDPEDLANSRVEVTIPVESVNTQNERRDNHLRSEDFFNTSQWQNIHFVSNSIEKTGDNQFVAHGELTIRDVTRNIELPFEMLGIMDHPMMDNTKVAGFSASTKIDRADYGVGVGDWAATMVVGGEVDIQINLELNSQQVRQ